MSEKKDDHSVGHSKQSEAAEVGDACVGTARHARNLVVHTCTPTRSSFRPLKKITSVVDFSLAYHWSQKVKTKKGSYRKLKSSDPRGKLIVPGKTARKSEDSMLYALLHVATNMTGAAISRIDVLRNPFNINII